MRSSRRLAAILAALLCLLGCEERRELRLTAPEDALRSAAEEPVFEAASLGKPVFAYLVRRSPATA